MTVNSTSKAILKLTRTSKTKQEYKQVYHIHKISNLIQATLCFHVLVD